MLSTRARCIEPLAHCIYGFGWIVCCWLKWCHQQDATIRAEMGSTTIAVVRSGQTGLWLLRSVDFFFPCTLCNHVHLATVAPSFVLVGALRQLWFHCSFLSCLRLLAWFTFGCVSFERAPLCGQPVLIWRVTLAMCNIEMINVRRLCVCVSGFLLSVVLQFGEIFFQAVHCCNLYPKATVLFL